jgi:1,4-dihydroxy-2-naphthoate octaprenyltransferase
MSVDAALREAVPRAWALWKMSRPSQLLLIVAVYALGVAIAVASGTSLDARAVLAGVAALVPTAAAVHYANEYADYETDADADRTPFSGGSGALHVTGLPRRLARDAMAVTLVVGALAGVGLLLAGLLSTAAAVLLASIAVLGLQYSLPPLSLAWHGVGELDNALLGGLLLPCYGAAVLGGLTVDVALAVVPFTLFVFVNLLETQWPDRMPDADVGKYTLPTRWSKRRLRATYWLVTTTGVVSLYVLTADTAPLPNVDPIPRLVTAATLPALPLFVWGGIRYTRREEPFPAVVGMVLVAIAQLLAWGYLAVFA